jgi:hypothetical protein
VRKPIPSHTSQTGLTGRFRACIYAGSKRVAFTPFHTRRPPQHWILLLRTRQGEVRNTISQINPLRSQNSQILALGLRDQGQGGLAEPARIISRSRNEMRAQNREEQPPALMKSV